MAKAVPSKSAAAAVKKPAAKTKRAVPARPKKSSAKVVKAKPAPSAPPIQPPAPSPAAPASRKKRTSSVRARILEILKTHGPLTSNGLVEAGGFSSSALYLNLKPLRDSGAVLARPNGREMVFEVPGSSSAESVSVPVPAKSAPPAKTSRVATPLKPIARQGAVAYIPAVIGSALDHLDQRLLPVENAEDKIATLERLSTILQGPLSSVLLAIRDDVVRLSAKV